MKIYKWNFIFFLITFIWVLFLIIAPLTLPKNSVEDLTGIVGKEDNEEANNDMNGFAKFIYKLGDKNCHQIKERSYFINGNELPFCTRCLGIFLGFAIGAAIISFKRFELSWQMVLIGLFPIGIDGTVQLMTSYESTNTIRMVTGLLVGAITSFAVGQIIFEVGSIRREKLSRANQAPYTAKESNKTEK